MKSAWLLRPAICGRTNSATSPRFRSYFSLRFTPLSPLISVGGRPIIPLSRLIDDIVYDSVFLRLLCIHNEVALHIFFYFVQLLTAVLGQQLVCNLPHTQDFTGVDVNVGGLSGQSSHRGLVD